MNIGLFISEYEGEVSGVIDLDSLTVITTKAEAAQCLL